MLPDVPALRFPKDPGLDVFTPLAPEVVTRLKTLRMSAALYGNREFVEPTMIHLRPDVAVVDIVGNELERRNPPLRVSRLYPNGMLCERGFATELQLRGRMEDHDKWGWDLNVWIVLPKPVRI